MITPHLISPKSIVVVGASENESKPGGKVVRNILNGGFKGILYAINKKPITIGGVQYLADVKDLPSVELAIIAIPASQCVQTVKDLIEKGTRAFIIYSAGFSEAGEAGVAIEKELVEVIKNANATLIGPNCVGVINETYKGVFTTPIPEYDKLGCELISSSGATAVFIMEAAIPNGLKFSNIYSIGNASQTGVEEILEYMDATFDSEKSPKVKLLYLEQIKNPFKFLKHATSLIQKGCRIAAIKSGFSEAGSRAATSHTGAMATSDAVVRALFKKCGIVYCSSREELIAVASIFQSKELIGTNIAIITHAGGSAVMLTDALTSNGLSVPTIDPTVSLELSKKLNPGSSVANPIDFLATGTAQHLGEIIDFCEENEALDAMVVVFGSPGLFNVKDVYDVLDAKMNSCKKPIYPVLPSLMNAKKEIEHFLSNGRVNFSDEVALGKALAHVYRSKKTVFQKVQLPQMDIASIRALINASESGYLSSESVNELMEAVGIEMANQKVCKEQSEILDLTNLVPFPFVMKVEGPVHKTEVDGVVLNINSEEQALQTFERLMQIPQAKGVLVQEMVSGEELYCGAAKQGDFGHLVLCGLGGIFLELLKDTASALAPLGHSEISEMVESLKGYPLIEGYRNKPGLNKEKFIDVIARVAALVHIAPEISELDINPIKANGRRMVAVDVRVKIEK